MSTLGIEPSRRLREKEEANDSKNGKNDLKGCREDISYEATPRTRNRSNAILTNGESPHYLTSKVEEPIVHPICDHDTEGRD